MGLVRQRPMARGALLAAALAASVLAPACRQGKAPAAAGPELRPATGSEVMAAVRRSPAAVVLVNVWATWCQPCREEFPDLLALRDRFTPGQLELVLVSGDFEDQAGQAAQFLAGQGVRFPSYLKTGNDMEFIEALSSGWSGALPATFVFDRRRSLHASWEGKADATRLADAVAGALAGSG